MKLFKHIYWAIRYGEWDIGWGQYEDKPQFGLFRFYYDGNIVVFHCWKFWIGVRY